MKNHEADFNKLEILINSSNMFAELIPMSARFYEHFRDSIDRQKSDELLFHCSGEVQVPFGFKSRQIIKVCKEVEQLYLKNKEIETNDST